MSSYYAYHGPENNDRFDYTNGYGVKLLSKVKKINEGDFVYVFERLTTKEPLRVYGKFRVIGKHLDPTKIHSSGRPFGVDLEDISRLDKPLIINDEKWSKAQELVSGASSWEEIQSMLYSQGGSLRTPLIYTEIAIFDNLLGEGVDVYTKEEEINIVLEDASLSDSEKLTEIKGRIGQARFKKNVKKLWKLDMCAVTGCTISEILIASHIKPWTECTNSTERWDGANGLLLCANVDALFDRYLITFRKKKSDYLLEIASCMDISQLRGLGIEKGMSLMLGGINFTNRARFEEYLAHHNAKFDKKTLTDNKNVALTGKPHLFTN